MLSLTSYLGSGEYRERYLGLRIPSTNVQPEQLEQTRKLRGCASRIGCSASRGSVVAHAPHHSTCRSNRPASVEQIHSAFGEEDYWLARIAAFGGSKTLDSLIVDPDGTVTVSVTEDLRRGALPGCSPSCIAVI